MALSKSALETALAAAYAKGLAKGLSPQDFAKEVAAAIDAYVKTAQVVVPGGSSSGTYPVT